MSKSCFKLFIEECCAIVSHSESKPQLQKFDILGLNMDEQLNWSSQIDKKVENWVGLFLSLEAVPTLCHTFQLKKSYNH